MSRGDDAYIADMLAEARRIGRFLDGMDRESFLSNELVQYAVMHALTLLGEAGRRVSDERRSGSPEVPWRRIGAMRNVIVHDYGKVDLPTIWKVASSQVPDLVPVLESSLGEKS